MTSFESIMSIKIRDCCTMYNPDKNLEFRVFFIETHWATSGGTKRLITKHQYSDFTRLDNSLWKLVPSYMYSYSHPKPNPPQLGSSDNKEEICSTFNTYINALFKWCATFSDSKNSDKVHEIFNAFLSNDFSADSIRCAELLHTEHDYMVLSSIFRTSGSRTKIPFFACSKHLVTAFGPDSGSFSDWLWKMNVIPAYESTVETRVKHVFVESLPEPMFARLSPFYEYDESLTADAISKTPQEGLVWVCLGEDDTYARYSNILSEISPEQRKEFNTVIINERYLEAVAGEEGACILRNVVTLVSQSDREWDDADKAVATALMRISGISLFMHDATKFDCSIRSTEIVVPNLKSFVECQFAAVACTPTATEGVFAVPREGFFLRKAFFALTRLDGAVDLGSPDADMGVEAVRRKFNSVVNEALSASVEAGKEEAGKNVVPSHNLGLLFWMPAGDGAPASKDLEYSWELVRASVMNGNLHKKMNEAIREYAGIILSGKGYSTWMKWLTGADKQIKKRLDDIKKSAERRLS